MQLKIEKKTLDYARSYVTGRIFYIMTAICVIISNNNKKQITDIDETYFFQTKLILLGCTQQQ